MNRGVLVHGVLLVCALLLGLQTLREDDGARPELGDVSIWSLRADTIAALTYVEGAKRVRVERRQDGDDTYFWAIETRERRPSGHDHGHAHDHGHDHHHGHGHDHGHDHHHDMGENEGHVHDYEGDFQDRIGEPGAATEPEAETEPETDPETESEGDSADEEDAAMSLVANGDADAGAQLETEEYPVGSEGEELFELFADLKALRDLGVPDDDQRESYREGDADAEIIVELTDGTRRTLEVGGRVYGGADRYVFEGDSGRAYVVRSRIVRSLRGGQSSLRLRRLQVFEADDVRSIMVETGGASRELLRLDDKDDHGHDHHHHHGSGGLGEARWAHAASPGEASQTLANFLGRVESLAPRSYTLEFEKADLEHLLTLRYRGEGGAHLGTLKLYRDDAPADGDGDGPAYYVWSERTRVLGVVSALAAERVDQDLEQVFADASSEPEPTSPAANE
jgi:hypothetical protein